jgi:hypothetical protein
MEWGYKIDASGELLLPADEASNRFDAGQLDPKLLPDVDPVN